jgi:hypothetical protein
LLVSEDAGNYASGSTKEGCYSSSAPDVSFNGANPVLMVVHCFGSVSDVDADNVKLVVNRCQEATDLG